MSKNSEYVEFLQEKRELNDQIERIMSFLYDKKLDREPWWDEFFDHAFPGVQERHRAELLEQKED